MATFSALDGDLGMMDQNWTAVARELGRLGELSGEDITIVEILDLLVHSSVIQISIMEISRSHGHLNANTNCWMRMTCFQCYIAPTLTARLLNGSGYPLT
jgi:hypothetical protein